MELYRPSWLLEADKLLGIKEGPGVKNNPEVVRLFRDAGHPEVIHDSTAWCAAYVSACLARANYPHTGTLWALDYAKYGIELDKPALGAIGVKKRYKGNKLVGGHVFFIVGWNDNWIWQLGGNQNDMCNIVKAKRSVLEAIRWPAGVRVREQPRILELNSIGQISNKED